MNKLIKLSLLLLALLATNMLSAQKNRPAAIEGRPVGAYTKYFKYFNPGGSGMPPNSVQSCKGVGACETFKYYQSQYGSAIGSVFFINTKRSDGKICMLTAGHTIAELKDNPKVGDRINMELYLKYYGQDNSGYAKTVSGIHASITNALLVAYKFEPNLDYAILLISKEMLPAKTVTTLGYDLQHDPTAARQYYTLGHTFSGPMRIADSLCYYDKGTTTLDLIAAGNNNIAAGNSGGPVFVKNTSNNSDAIIGIAMAAAGCSPIPREELVGADKRADYFEYCPYTRVIRLSCFADTIRRYAQTSTSASAQSTTTDPFLLSEDIDNTANWNAFQIDVSASNLAELNSASSPEYATENSGKKLFRANSLTLNFDYQATTAAQNLVSTCLASQSNLENGFSFTAGSNTELSIYAIVPEPVDPTASMRKTNNATFEEAAETDRLRETEGYVYPNPSHTGIFTAVLTGNAVTKEQHYALQVFASTGKLVYESPVTHDTQIRFDIHNQPAGTYFALLKDNSGHVLLRKQLVYLAH